MVSYLSEILLRKVGTDVSCFSDAYYRDSILDDKRTTFGEPKPRGKIAKARRSK